MIHSASRSWTSTDAVITACAAAVAETGTLILDGSADQGRRVISLIPDYHLCVWSAPSRSAPMCRRPCPARRHPAADHDQRAERDQRHRAQPGRGRARTAHPRSDHREVERGGVFVCPVCGEPLNRVEQAFRCVAGHAFDIAKEGYVNLLAPQHRRSKDPGYSKEMIAGRRDFFDAGHYRPLADNVAALIAGYLPTSSERLVVDAGCGEGYYLRRLRATLAAIGAEDSDGPVRAGHLQTRHPHRGEARSVGAVRGRRHLPLAASARQR